MTKGVFTLENLIAKTPGRAKLSVLALTPWAELQQKEASYQVNQGPKVTDASKFSR